MSIFVFKSKRFATLQTALLFCFAIIAILQALGCNLLGNNSSKDALPTTVTTILESQNNANSAALIKEVGGLKIEIAANSFNTNYSLKIQKIETEVDPITANIIKSDLTLSQDLLFVSPIYLLTVTAETGASNLRLSAINDALALTYPASLTIQLNNHTRDRAKYNYYTAWADENKNWFYEPLSKSDDLTTVVKRLLTLGKYYCVIARDKTSSAEAESLEVSPLALTLVASITEKFEQAPELSVSLGTSAQIDFANSSADLPKLRLIAFTPFDFAPQIKSEQLLPPYYKEVPLSLSDLVSQSGALATFSLSLPLTDITYDPAKHPAALFFDASWLSSSNTAYTSNIACISFGKLTRAAAAIVSPLADAVDVFVTNPVVFSFNKEMAPNSLDNALSIVPNTAVTTQYNYVEGSKNELVITPTQNWLYNTDYTITLATSALDINGYALTAQTVLNFSTVVATAPNPNLVSPSNLMSAKLSDNIVIAFETPMATDSVIPDQGIWVKKQNTDINYDLVWSPEKTLLEIVLHDDLVENASYTIGLDSSIVKSAADIFLTEDKQLTFITERPVPIASIVSPAENATNVFVTNPVVVNFSKQMDPNSLDNALSIVPNTVVATQYNYVEGSKNELVITPTQNWLYNTDYTITLATSALDINGYALTAQTVLNFSTVVATAPNPNLVSPSNLMSAKLSDNIVIAFETPMATDSVIPDQSIWVKKQNTYIYNYDLVWSPEKTLLEIVLPDDLVENASYTIGLDSSIVKSAADIFLTEDKQLTFITERPVPIASIVSPAENATNVFVTNPVVVNFSKQMDPNSLDNALSIVPNTVVATQYNYVEGSKNELVITPTQNWLYNTAYTITLDSTMTDTTGLAAPAVSSSFTTVAAPTLTANLVTPAVLTDVSSDSAIIIAFNSQVATNTISAGNGITIKKDTVTVSDYTLNFSAQDTLLTIEFSQALAEGSTYEITLPASVIKNTYGLPLANDFTAAFTVREPVVVPFTATIVSPLNNAQDIYLNNPVVVDFSKQVAGDYFEPGNIGNYVVISPAVTFTADYSYTAGVENRLTITPATQWAANTQYTVTIATNTGDMSHEPMAASAQVKFTTIDMPPPEIIFASPLNKDISRQTDKVILSFTKPMNPETFTKGTGVKIRKANFTETNFGNGEDVAPADYELQWSTDNTSCEIVFSDGLETVRAYEITLDSSVVACEDQIHPAETFVGVFRVCPFARGLGTEASPFEIASATDLISISSDTYFYSRHYKQTEDVDLTDYGSSYNGGKGFAPICSLYGGDYFTGVYNGNDKKISKLYIKRNSDFQGLFGKIRNATIHNLFLENVNITTSNAYVGALAGYTTGSEIRDVRVSGEITAHYVVGGITGYASADYNGLQSQIIRCSADVDIEPANSANSTSNYLGGIVGYLTDSLVSQCFTRVNIEGTQFLGGVVGYSINAKISDCQSEGRVFGNDFSADVGGILGLGGATTISDCSSDASNVTGDDDVGGIAGDLYNNCAVINCVNNTVTLTGNVDVGRIVGYLGTDTTINNCYSREDSTVNGSALEPDTIGISTSGKHGANVSFESLTDESWWTDTVGWNLGTIWEFDTKPIPTLIDVFILGDFV